MPTLSLKRLPSLLFLLAGSLPIDLAWAGSRPQVDLSIEVNVSPPDFVPGGRNTVTMMIRNAGPDTAGATVPNQDTINVYQGDFIVTTRPPPFEIAEPVAGCWIERFVSEPTEDWNILLTFIFRFGPIPAGESRTCTYDIQFYPDTRRSFPTGWLLTSPNDDDTDRSNNRFDYEFRARPVSIPTLSPISSALLGFGLLWLATRVRRMRDARALHGA